MLERMIERKLNSYAKSRKALSRKVIYAGRTGSPDRWFFKHGRVLMIELKQIKGKLSPNQASEIETLAAHGMEVHVCYGLDEARAVLEDWLNRVDSENLV